MSVYLVSRHPGAVDWMRQMTDDGQATVIAHVGSVDFAPGDKVCGVLPLAIAARICAAGAQAHVISFDMPAALRGQELDAAMLRRLGAKLVRYDVRIVD